MQKCVTVWTLVLTLGLHWALFQAVAWTGMLIAYSSDASFEEAVVKTFDGRHPCSLCKVIRKGRAEEKAGGKQQAKPASKLEMSLADNPEPLSFDADKGPVLSVDSDAPRRPDEPPKPRPRNPFLDRIS